MLYSAFRLTFRTEMVVRQITGTSTNAGRALCMLHVACLNIATVTPTMHTMYYYSEYMYIRVFCFLEIPQNYNPVLIPSLVMAVEPDSRFGTTIVGYSHSLLPPPPVFEVASNFPLCRTATPSSTRRSMDIPGTIVEAGVLRTKTKKSSFLATKCLHTRISNDGWR